MRSCATSVSSAWPASARVSCQTTSASTTTTLSAGCESGRGGLEAVARGHEGKYGGSGGRGAAAVAAWSCFLVVALLCVETAAL
jgi:hypothetical protein